MWIFALASFAFAGDRYLPWTYAADTEEANEIELEHYLTLETPITAGVPSFEWQHQVELEYGITKRLEAGAYLVASQTGGGPLSFSGYKARLRYRLGNSASVVNSCVYLEYVGTPTFDQHELEGKVILSRTAGRVSAALNLTGELHFGAENDFTFEPTGGAMFAVVPNASFGLEGKLEATATKGGFEGPYIWLGPAMHLVSAGVPDPDGDGDQLEGRLSWTVGGMMALTPDTRSNAGVEVRSLVALEL